MASSRRSHDLPCSWRQRFNLSSAAVDSKMDLFSIATAAALWYRCSPMPAAAHAFLAFACFGFLSNIGWRWCCRGAPDGGSWLAWREVPAAVFRLAGFGFGAGCFLMKTFLDGVQPASPTGGAVAAAAWHALLLFRGSAVPNLLSLWVARPLRISWAVPVQLALTLDVARHNIDTCHAAAFALGEPSGRRLMHQAFQLLGTLRSSIFPAVSDAGLPPDVECTVVLTYVQLSLGFLLPAVAQALYESRWFMQHQKELQRRELPAPRGFEAWLYGSIADLGMELWASTGVLAVLGLMAILWDAALLLGARQ